ncbi:glycoside hydrolase family 18 [Pedobacter sp.]|jgi:hypothetical protein|uniref:glycoside hydrolase family 18 n=1 Tax=Pedobacter sp. TaxID=1411316 RepID=UPI002C60F181|nr:glycoside hydrolase family 18 [Pedobacter sp.]HWW42669.1 glycoside hydrolase family 18 [Pedobacter sp.]
MKQPIQKYPIWIGLLVIITGLFFSFTSTRSSLNGKDSTSLSADSTSYLKQLLKYKASDHLLAVGYVVADGNDPEASTNLSNLPDSLDIVSLFVGYDPNPDHWRAAQKKGIKIVKTIAPNSAYFDHSVNDPITKTPGYVRPAGIDPNVAKSTSTYDHYAKNKYMEYVVQNRWDGLDVDIETGMFGAEVPAYNAAKFLSALAKYFGPNCTSCTINPNGKKPLFIYDTDVIFKGRNIGYDVLFEPSKSNYDYVYFQSYIGGNRAWRGSGTQDFPPIVKAYGSKFIALVNGDQYIYANGGQDSAPDGDAKTLASLLSYAQWMKDNNGGGAGAYRMSRDYNHKPVFKNIREAIQIMNPGTKSK